MRETFFKSLAELEFKLEYIGILIRKNNKIIEWMNIILAFASSGAIAGWAIFKDDFFLLWAIIIGLAQVITVIRPQLSLDKLSESLPKVEIKLMSIFLEMEKLWYDVDNELMDSREIHEILCDMDKLAFEAISQYLENVKFDNKKIKAEADSNSNMYLIRKYGGTINE